MYDSEPAYPAGREISVSAATTLAPAVRPRARVAASVFPRTFTILLLVLLALTRWQVAPRYLYYFDSANFALSLEQFNPALHQPQPPGYPLFVGLIRIVHLWVDDAAQVMLIAGIVGAAAAVCLLLALGTAMFGRTAGIIAATLLASDPVFWFGGVTNQVRIFLSFGIVLVGLTAWRALTNPDKPGWLYGMFGALGVAAGFRPIETWLLLPLALWVWYRCGHSWRRLALGSGMLAGTTLPWLAACVWAVGSPAGFISMIRHYAQDQFTGSSALYGATPPAAWHMALMAAGWTVLGGIVWLWAIPFVDWRGLGRSWRTQSAFLALAFLPPFLFSAVVHVGDPDQTLASVSILSLTGGAVLSRLLASSTAAKVYVAAGMLAVAHASTFYHSPYHLAEAASYNAVRRVDRMTTETIGALNALRAQGPLTIVHYGSTVASRQITYYFPDDYVDILPGQPGLHATGEPVYTFFRHRGISPGDVPEEGLIRAGSQRIVCLVPPYAHTSLPGWRKAGPVYVLDVIPQKGVEIGDYRLIWENR